MLSYTSSWVNLSCFQQPVLIKVYTSRWAGSWLNVAGHFCVRKQQLGWYYFLSRPIDHLGNAASPWTWANWAQFFQAFVEVEGEQANFLNLGSALAYCHFSFTHHWSSASQMAKHKVKIWGQTLGTIGPAVEAYWCNLQQWWHPSNITHLDCGKCTNVGIYCFLMWLTYLVYEVTFLDVWSSLKDVDISKC